MKSEKIYRILYYILATVMVMAALLFITPIFFFDQFKINGQSMEPTLVTGDHVLVNKLLMGARIYTKYDFSDPDMECFRMPGFRKLRPGDVAVFNYPEGYDRGKVEFRINYVYAKRCIGCPGDTVGIEDGYYYNRRLPDSPVCPVYNQKILSSMSDHDARSDGLSLAAIPFSKEYRWTIRNLGPLYIPEKGGEVKITPSSVRLYKKVIEYETGFLLVADKGIVYLDGEPIDRYVFRGNWYFFGGDNVLNSKDSRYIGFVPEDYIIGIATRVLFSKDRHSGKFTWKRLFKRISHIADSPLFAPDVEAALVKAGENRKELEKVLLKYRMHTSDSLKFRAAEYLIANMPGHSYYEGQVLDDFLEYYRVLYEFRQEGKWPVAASDSIKAKYGAFSLSMLDRKEDLYTVDSSYLCDNIEWAFKVREEQPWSSSIPFGDFCRYILPYRIGDEALTSWRKEYYTKYNGLLDSLRTAPDSVRCNPVNAVRCISDALLGNGRMLFTSIAPASLPHIGPAAADYRNGSCRDLSDFTVYVCRALGIPCAEDSMPLRGNDNIGHTWVALWSNTGDTYIQDFSKEILPLSESAVKTDFKVKVYRSTFEINEELAEEAGRIPEEDCPSIYDDLRIKDMTAIYASGRVENLEIPDSAFYSRTPKSVVYLASSSYMSWMPLTHAFPEKGKVVFKDIAKGGVLRVVSIDGGRMRFLTDPFWLNTNGSPVFFRPDGSYQDMNIYAKHTLIYELPLRKRIIGGVFEAGNSPDFSSPDTLAVIEQRADRLVNVLKFKEAGPYRYIRYVGSPKSHCNMAELTFYGGADGSVLHGVPMGTPGCRGDDGTHEYTNLFDGSSETSFDYKYESGGWAGLDLGEKKVISKVEYIPRNRDNYIRKGDTYEMFYCDKIWKSCGTVTAESDSIAFRNVPSGTIYIVKNHTRGSQMRIFIYKDGKQIWK